MKAWSFFFVEWATTLKRGSRRLERDILPHNGNDVSLFLDTRYDIARQYG
jgi:hypothetical protein